MSLNILVVDDSRMMRSVLIRTLEISGLDVGQLVQAANGREGLDALEKNWIDLALVDINMPVMNGIEFLRALRASPGGNAPIVLFCTTETEMTKIQQAIEAGANEYIMKPFDSEIVESKLMQVGLL